MIKDLAKLATRLDRLGLTKEADVLDSALQKLARSVQKQQGDRAAAMGAGIFGGDEDPLAAISDSKLPAGMSGAIGNLRAPSRTQIGAGGLAARSPGFGASPGVAEMGRSDYDGGGKYSTPLSTAPGKPGVATEGRARGLPSNPWRSFLHASPRSIAEFNDTLSQMFEIVPRTSKLVPADVRSNLPKGQVKWTDQTQKAFGVIANLAGYPEAGKPGGWSGPDGGKDGILGWAQRNNYEPTMNGILKFWDDNKQKVIDRLTQELYEFAAAAEAQATAGIEKQQKQEGDISTIGDSNQESKPPSAVAKTESPAAAGAKGVVATPKLALDYFVGITWKNPDPVNSIGYWNIDDNDKMKLYQAWLDKGHPPNDRQWAREYIINNKIPGGWYGRGPDGKYIQESMTPITTNPVPPKEIDPRDFFDMGGAPFSSFKREVENFPNGQGIFKGWSRADLDQYLERHDLKLENGKLIDLRVTKK